MPKSITEVRPLLDPGARVRARTKTAGDSRIDGFAPARDSPPSEFFTKNRHLLGFDNPAKALLTTVKEAVDNSLDACEEAGILPGILVENREVAGIAAKVSKAKDPESAGGERTVPGGPSRFRIVVEATDPAS